MTIPKTAFTSETGRAHRAKAGPRGPNKIPTAFADSVMESFHNRGGVRWLDSLSDELFVPIFKTMAPKIVQGPDGAPIQFLVFTGVTQAPPKPDDPPARS